MDNKIPKHKRIPKRAFREDVFRLYVLWCSLPPILKQDFPDKQKTMEQMGFQDTQIEMLLGLKRQGDFAAKFKLQPGTLSDWNKRIDYEGLVKDVVKVWARKLTPNVMSALYTKAMKYGDAHRAKIWLQYVEGWVEETKTTTELPFLTVKEGEE